MREAPPPRPSFRRRAARRCPKQQMMIDDDDVRLRRFLAGLEEEAFVVQLAACPLAEVGLGRDLVPHFGSRSDRQVAERSVARSLRPFGDRVELLLNAVIEQRVARGPRVSGNWGEAAVLPAYNRLVIDEGHHLEDAAATHLGSTVSRRSLTRLFNRLERRGKGFSTRSSRALPRRATCSAPRVSIS